jgi:DNA-binding CsgD family transcriptional regulator
MAAHFSAEDRDGVTGQVGRLGQPGLVVVVSRETCHVVTLGLEAGQGIAGAEPGAMATWRWAGMTAYLEVWKPSGVELVLLETRRVTIGRNSSNDVPLAHDKTVSGLHAVLEPVGGGWCVQDVGSRNGTFVRGERILGMCALRHGDDLAVGRTKLVFRAAEPAGTTRTEGSAPPPELTRRERDVLRALCRHLVSGQVFTEPASLHEIATTLVVTEAAVQQHLLRLYDKFGIAPGTGSRRGQLANEAIRRGAVPLADLWDSPP